MRTISAAQDAVLTRSYRGPHLRVRVEDLTLAFVDLTSLRGKNYVISAAWGQTLDRPVATAQVVLNRELFELSLSPLKTVSVFNQPSSLLRVHQPIVIETAVIPMDEVPVEADFQEMFRGRIDEIDFGGKGGKISLRCRDQGGDLQDEWIENQTTHGDGDQINVVIQDILDTHADNSPTLNTIGSPAFAINDYLQQKETIFGAIRKLSQMIGWELRYRWDNGGSDFKLSLFEPGRPFQSQGTMFLSGAGPSALETFTLNSTVFTEGTDWSIGATISATAQSITDAINTGAESANTYANRDGDDVVITWQASGTAGNSIVFTNAMTGTVTNGAGTLGGTVAGTSISAVRTFNSGEYQDLPKISIKSQDVRNRVRVIIKDPTANRTNKVVFSHDSTSESKYGPRFMEIAQDGSGQIDTFTEAKRMADTALADLSEPDLDHSVSMPFFWPAQLDDVYTFEANGVHYDNNQTLAVVGFQHSLTEKKSTTTLDLRGKPALGIKRWISLDGRPGVAPATDESAESNPTPVCAVGVGLLVVTYDEPTRADWRTTEVYLDTSAIAATTFPDKPSSILLAASGRQTRFEIGGLTPGTTYFGRLIILDKDNNFIGTTDFVQDATQRVGPYHENLDGQQDQLIRNPDFNVFTLGTSFMPDFWLAETGAFLTEITVETVNVRTGDKALKLAVTVGTPTTSVTTDFIPIPEDEILQMGVLARPNTVPANQDINLEISFFDISKVLIGVPSSSAITLTNGLYSEENGSVIQAPATARFAKVRLEVNRVGVDYEVVFDRCGLVRTYVSARRNLATDHTFAGTSFEVVDFDSPQTEEIGISYATGVYTVDLPGTYIFNTRMIIGVDANSVAHSSAAEIQLDSGSGYVTIANDTGASFTPPSGGVISLRQVQTSPLELATGDLLRSRAQISTVGGGGTDVVNSGTAVFFAGRMMERSTK